MVKEKARKAAPGLIHSLEHVTVALPACGQIQKNQSVASRREQDQSMDWRRFGMVRTVSNPAAVASSTAAAATTGKEHSSAGRSRCAQSQPCCPYRLIEGCRSGRAEGTTWGAYCLLSGDHACRTACTLRHPASIFMAAWRSGEMKYLVPRRRRPVCDEQRRCPPYLADFSIRPRLLDAW